MNQWDGEGRDDRNDNEKRSTLWFRLTAISYCESSLISLSVYVPEKNMLAPWKLTQDSGELLQEAYISVLFSDDSLTDFQTDFSWRIVTNIAASNLESSFYNFCFHLKWLSFFLIILFFKFTILYWFSHILKWIHHRYTCVPPPSPYHPSGSSQCTSPKHPVSCIEPGLVTHFMYVIIHVSMPFSQIIPPSPSPTESKRLFYTSVPLLLSRIQGYCYHLSKFHIYALVYCIGVFLSGLLHSV